VSRIAAVALAFAVAASPTYADPQIGAPPPAGGSVALDPASGSDHGLGVPSDIGFGSAVDTTPIDPQKMIFNPKTKRRIEGEADEPDTIKASKLEVGGLPLIGGDTDIGFGGGVVGNVAKLDPKATPYVWNLEFEAFYATKTGFLSPSYEDSYLLFTMPELWHKRLKLELRPSFTKDSDLPYFGLGNQIRDFQPQVESRDWFVRYHPAMSVNATLRIRGPYYVMGGAQYTWNKIEYASTSTLANDIKFAEPFVRDALQIVPDHSVMRLQAAAIYDTRDNVISTYDGQYHQIEIRESPKLGDAFPYSYQQVDAQARFYHTPIKRYLTLSARFVFDAQFGNPPFYELTRYEETSAIGGSLGVRGVPAYQYYGKVKAFANFEARSETFRKHFWGKTFVLGFAAFVDGGRIWSDLFQSHPELDGTGLGLHYGIGGGLRLLQGHTGVIRADFAWSPDARPVGLYLIANQIF
jgi:Omp85 superfamily domain